MLFIRLIVICSLSFWMCTSAGNNVGPGSGAIQAAKSENKYLFLFFYKEQNPKTVQQEAVFDQTIQDLHHKINAAKINADDPSEKAIVDKFKLKHSPMPFVVILAPNGAVTGGFSHFTKQQLTSSMISPGAAKCLTILQNRKMVLLCLQNQKTKDNAMALQGVKDFKADPRFNKRSDIVVIDPADKSEKSFLKKLGLIGETEQARTVLITPPAIVVAKYLGKTSKDQLYADIKNATSGCCGGGGCCGSSGCCPGGCCK